MHNGAPVHFMNRQQIQEIILRVLAECGEQGKEQELPLDFPVEVSAKHVHLTREAVEQLFGTGVKLTPKRPPVPAGTVFKRRAGHFGHIKRKN